MKRILRKISRISINDLLWLSIALFAIGISTITQILPENKRPFRGDEFLRDHYIQLRASDLPESRISLIDIDEGSIANLGRWPWPRNRIATLIENLLSDYGARGVALDIFFSESDNTFGDSRLAMLAEHGPVVLAQAFDFDQQRSWPLHVGNLAGAISLTETEIKKYKGKMAIATGYISNHAGLSKAPHVGNIGFVPDIDGTLRRIPAFTQFGNKIYPALSQALLNCCAKTDAKTWVDDRRTSDTDDRGFFRVDFSRKLTAYSVLSAESVLDKTAPIELLQNRLIIIGSSSLSLGDRVATPLFYSTSGYLVHAEALSTLLDAQQGRVYSKWPGKWIAILFSILTASAAAYMFPRFSALSNALILGASSAIWLALAYFVTAHDMWFSPISPLLGNFFLLAIAVPFGWQTSQKKSRRLLGTLHQYVAKAVVQELLRSDLKDPLAPRQLVVTTLIADMEGYTSRIEHLSMESAADLTREFLECLTAPVLALGGTLDKYTGDGLVAFWGAPLPVENHADLAVDAAIQIVRNVKKLSEKYTQQGGKNLRVRIGIESGIAIAGDFGSSFRSIYTAVGDSVNTASRLEDAARNFKYDIVIGNGTVDASTRHQFLLLGKRMLRGKEKPTTLYTVEIPE